MKLRFVAILVISLSSLAIAREEVNRTLDVSPSGFVDIEVPRGHLVVNGWTQQQIRVRGFLDDRVREFVFEVNGDQAQVKVKLPRRTGGWFEGDTTDLTIDVPQNSRVEIYGVSTTIRASGLAQGLTAKSVSGDVDISDVDEGVTIRTVSGEVELRRVTGRVRVESVSGEINAVTVPGQGSYNTVSGHIEVRGGGERLDLESVSGDLDVQSDVISEFSGQSVSGDVTVESTLGDKGRLEVSTISGDIAVALPATTSAVVDLKTAGGGQIRNRLNDRKPSTLKHSSDQTLYMTLGEGQGEVLLRTTSGRIILGR